MLFTPCTSPAVTSCGFCGSSRIFLFGAHSLLEDMAAVNSSVGFKEELDTALGKSPPCVGQGNVSGAVVHQDGRQLPGDGRQIWEQRSVDPCRDGIWLLWGCLVCWELHILCPCRGFPLPFPNTRSLTLLILRRVQDSTSAASAPNAAAAPTASPSSPAAPSQPSTSSSAAPDAGSGSRRSSGSGTVGGPGDGGPNSAASILCKWGL